jgi:hypothetical protein
MSKSLEDIFADVIDRQQADQGGLPPVADWDPPKSGDIDIRIARDGTWYHEGKPIHRDSLVRLFSSILKREGDDYFLVTPVEKWQIQVDDVPFHMRHLDVLNRNGNQALVFEAATGDRVTAGPANPIRVRIDPETGEPSPYIRVRDGMEGLIARNVFYELAEIAERDSPPGTDKEKAVHGVYSLGEFFPLE